MSTDDWEFRTGTDPLGRPKWTFTRGEDRIHLNSVGHLFVAGFGDDEAAFIDLGTPQLVESLADQLREVAHQMREAAES